MKSLLQKDLYTLTRQAKLFLLMILVFALLPSGSTAAFAVVYSAMLPISALAYDERCKWNELAAMMPYSTRDLVWSKYLLGYLFVGASSLLSILAKAGMALFLHRAPAQDEIYTLLLTVCVGLLLMAINLPLMFRFGVERGRMAFVIVTALFVLGAVLVAGDLTSWLERTSLSPTAILLPAFAVVVLANLLSAALSMRFLQRK